MSGVVALLGYSPDRSSELVTKMCQALKHRGPEDSGWFADSKVALGNVASFNGSEIVHQPLSNGEKDLWITFSGTLYNDGELKRQLDVLATASDAELVLHAYESKGLDCLEMLEGAFAFCLWDSSQGKLISARDRFGIKQLFYLANGNRCVLASEIKAMFVDPTVSRKPNHDLLCKYLLYGYHFRAGDTCFDQIKEVLPGHYLVHSLGGGKPQHCEYWHLPPSSAMKKGKGDYSAILLDKLRKGMEKMLPANVPFATCMSGGIDSETIASLIDEQLVKTRSVGKHMLVSAVCDGASRADNEEPYIKEYERFRGAKVKYVQIKCPIEWKEMRKLVHCLEEPFATPSIYLFYRLACDLKNESVKVAFLGTSMDLFLWGLYFDRNLYLKSLWQKKAFATLLTELIGTVVHQDLSFFSFRGFAKILDQFMAQSPAGWHAQYSFRFLNPRYITQNYIQPEESQVDRTIGGSVEFLQGLDRVFSAFSVDARFPALDLEFTLFMNSLPANQRIRRGVQKYVLRKASKGLIPEAVRKSNWKFGSAVPLVKWMIGLQPEIVELLSSKKFREREIFNQYELLKTFDLLCSGKLDPAYRSSFCQLLWMVIGLELWFQIYIDPITLAGQ